LQLDTYKGLSISVILNAINDSYTSNTNEQGDVNNDVLGNIGGKILQTQMKGSVNNSTKKRLDTVDIESFL
jgi:hypothetical protein